MQGKSSNAETLYSPNQFIKNILILCLQAHELLLRMDHRLSDILVGGQEDPISSRMGATEVLGSRFFLSPCFLFIRKPLVKS
jgi:hypothetical protein